MKTDEAVEGVARAIWQVSAEPEHGDDWSRVSASAWGDNLRCHARAAIAAMQSIEGWRDMATAPKDGTRILAVYRHPSDERHWNGRIFEVWHEGYTVSGFDMGWGLFPGHGGVPGHWFAGWMPSPAHAILEDGERGDG